MSYTLGFDRCKCLTQLEKYHIENSLNNELKKIEKNIKKEKESTKKGKSLLKIKKELKIIIGNSRLSREIWRIIH